MNILVLLPVGGIESSSSLGFSFLVDFEFFLEYDLIIVILL